MPTQRCGEIQEIVADNFFAAVLQPPEAVILSKLRARLATMRMLDIGVGAGRTMLHFAPVAGEYWGIDYSAEMIAACHARRPARVANLTLAFCDARADAVRQRLLRLHPV